jgi:hypothetical protein
MRHHPSAHLGVLQQAGEGMLKTRERDRLSGSRGEQHRAVTVNEWPLGPVGVVPHERPAQIGADGDQSWSTIRRTETTTWTPSLSRRSRSPETRRTRNPCRVDEFIDQLQRFAKGHVRVVRAVHDQERTSELMCLQGPMR